MKHFLILLLICIFSFFLFFFKITSVPPGINGDEVGIGRNAYLISKNLTDENNNFLPLFVFARDSDWKQPVTVYTTALVFKVFGPSLYTLRGTSILFILMSLILFYFLSKEKFNFKFFLMGSLIFLTVPIILIQSHLALENIALLPFILFWLLMLAKFDKSKKTLFLILGGASLGIGIFSYLGMRLVVPVLCLVTIYHLRKSFRNIIYFLVGAIPFFALLFVSNFYYPNAVIGRYGGGMQSIYDYLFRTLSIFDLSFLFLKGDSVAYHSTGKSGMFLVSSLPIFILGIRKILKDKKPFEVLVLLSFFLSPLFFGFVPEIYRASRLLALIPFYLIISTIGFISLPKKWGIIIATLIIINYLVFARDYWFTYPNRIKQAFPMTMDYYNYDFTRNEKTY